ncbi:MAG: LysM peptidoglycan-binding domain-containing M23 family metallopeptidase [Hyphomicrobiales bacterium]|nr:LysM peptidoglycan-binding domain-containing M23 family metallopeptidase [Hyphomicrobiales bacterium]
MRNRISTRQSGFLGPAISVVALAGLAAACSTDATGVREPFFTGSTPNQREIIANAQPGGTAVASTGVPGAGGPIDLAASGAGGGWSAVGGRVVTVGPGESLDTLALKYGVPSSEIARANGISSPSQITQGRSIVIPQRAQTVAYATPQPGAAAAPTPVAAAGGTHTVETGQTLYSISRMHGVSVDNLVAANSLAGQTIRVGQQLTIPGGSGAQTKTASLTTGPGTAPKPLGTIKVNPDGTTVPVNGNPAPRVISGAPAPELPVVPAKAVASLEPAPAAAVESADPPSSDGTSFRWPVRGRIISGFGPKTDGERNDGINLAVPAGTSVKAAEAGTVIYSGNELAGYGNLVLIRHADGWVSAYAHNDEVDVKRGDTVKRGSTIGKAGTSGSVSSPQVHFELRKGAKPVNPMDYLSGA